MYGGHESSANLGSSLCLEDHGQLNGSRPVAKIVQYQETASNYPTKYIPYQNQIIPFHLKAGKFEYWPSNN